MLAGASLVRSEAFFELHRRGEPDQAWFDYQFSPVFDDDGAIAGVLNIAVEATGRVLGERARAEAAAATLQESERRLRSVLEGMDEAFVLMDHDFRILTQHEAALPPDGRPEDEIVRRTYWEVYPGSETSELGHRLKHAMTEREPVTLEHRHGRPRGREGWLETRAFPVPEGLAVFWRNVTERKDAEIALSRSEARIRKLLDIDTVGVVFFDLVGGILDANDAFLSMIGYSRAELDRGEVRYEHLTPADWRWRDEQTISELKLEGKAGPFEKEYIHKNGSRIWIYCVDTMLGDGTAAEIVIDVTERKRAEAALRESERRLRAVRQRLRAAADAAGLGIWEWDFTNDRPTWEDGRIYDIFGNPHDAPPVNYEQLVNDFLHPDDKESLEKAIQAAVEIGSFHVACRITRASDGASRWIDYSGRLDTDGDGPERMVGAVVDITERRLAEEHKNMLMAELDHRVKNILALVQSIARQTLGSGGDAGPDAADRLIGRIGALAQSHRLLASSRWEGAKFRELVDGAVAPYRGHRPGRISSDGPDLKLTPKAAQTLTLALHELVTNAAKYGSLSRDEGRVSAEWRLSGRGDERCLIFCWQEFGGPAIEAPPDRKGFGSSLIERTLAYELEGDVTVEFARDGLRVEIRLRSSCW